MAARLELFHVAWVNVSLAVLLLIAALAGIVRRSRRRAVDLRIDQLWPASVAIRIAMAQFRLRVQDDGKGFDEALLPRQAAAGHYGVPGMRERAVLMGGTLTVWSKEGAGAAVELCIPSRCAYVKTRERRWLSRAFAGE